MTDSEKRIHTPTGHDKGTPVYDHPTGGWGSLRGVSQVFREAEAGSEAIGILGGLNKPKGVMCPSCAWAKPAKAKTFEFCENGAKSVLWELMRDRVGAEFFDAHPLSELRGWHDHDLEKAGRLTEPVRYDPASDRYRPVAWADAFAEIGAHLRAHDPKTSVFYASGHAGLEASYLYALFARAMGHQNLPQSSNMCHETTSVNLKRVIGTPVGTCTLEDFEVCDAIFFFGQNTGTNSPRFLHQLKAAVDRGCRIVTFNPLRERGLIEFADPQNPVQMTFGKPTRISEKYYQLRPGGDVAVLAGMIKHVLAAEDAAPGTVLDHAFLDAETHGGGAAMAAIRTMGWDEIETVSGLTRAMIEEAADIYLGAERVIGIYGMGLTQHVHGWLNIGMLVNLLLLRGHMGRPGTGISPVRGHSNVQGQRTVGIGEKSDHMPADRLRALFGIEAPNEDGMNAVEACEALLEGRLTSMICLGGNLVRALPDSERIEAAWSTLGLTVQVATKLNRSHLVPGKVAYLLPCLGRSDADLQDGIEQAVSVEDSLSHIYGSIGTATPPGERVLSELAIVAGIAAATLDPDPRLDWDGWRRDYARVRDLIEQTFPDQFDRFNERLFQPGGFYRGSPVKDRIWKTESRRAEFTTPDRVSALGVALPARDPSRAMTLITLRSNDQFNTTIYGFSDRLRGLEGSREVVLINRDEIARLGLSEGQRVALVSTVEDGVQRRVDGLAVTAFDLPEGCVAGYYPELNPLIPLDLHERHSKTPAYKGAPVRIVAE
ncbi:FdhF/YdeP family oxidoreductase [Frigidibacter sp. MR17.24]|uniref:FdhF/YdeP family oxidoreductase n=1 Tax=Frigidibacter sp. MR17.24 TaxID=3127345 RepID=UPI003012F3E9